MVLYRRIAPYWEHLHALCTQMSVTKLDDQRWFGRRGQRTVRLHDENPTKGDADIAAGNAMFLTAQSL
jgi:hypothetical protein